MGYSISQRTYELLEKRRKEGRLCKMDRPHIARAVWKVRSKVWNYYEDRVAGKPHSDSEMEFCNRCYERYLRYWVGREDGDSNQMIVSAERY